LTKRMVTYKGQAARPARYPTLGRIEAEAKNKYW
jgi:hypothetical protein